MLLLALTLLVAGLALLWASEKSRAAAGLPPDGRVVSIDPHRPGQPAPALYDPKSGLAGRPDFVVQGRGGWVPVEVKSGPAPAEPYAGHRLQLAAYCRLVEAAYGRRPAYGLLRYADRAYAIDYTPALERDLWRMVDELRRWEGRAPDRSHRSRARCLACGYQAACNQRLA